MEDLVNMKYVYGSMIFTGLGLVLFILSFTIFELITPKVSLWKELVEKQNIAVAIFVASIMIGISQIIASAIHG